MFLVDPKNHLFVPHLNLAETLEDLHRHVGDVWVVFQGEPYDLLSADHVQLVYAPLTHLFLQIVGKHLLIIGPTKRTVLVRALFVLIADVILAQS